MKKLNKSLLFISSILLCSSFCGCSSSISKENISSIDVIAPESTEYLKKFDESSVELVVTLKTKKRKLLNIKI